MLRSVLEGLFRSFPANRARVFSIVFRVFLLLAFLAPPVSGALPIEVEVAVERGAPIDAMQTWSRVLSQMDLTRARLRGARGREQPTVTVDQLGGRKRYRVVGFLTRANQLHLPGGKFRTGDTKRLRQFFAELPQRTDHGAVERGRFGLTEAQFKEVYAAFSQPIAPSAARLSVADALQRATEDLPGPLELSPLQQARLKAAGQTTAGEMRLSTGAAIALWLRRAGLMFVPQQLPGQSLEFRVAAYNAKTDHWPPGWKPTGSVRQAAPKLYQFRTIEIDGYTLAEATAALEKFIEIPIVWDEWILARGEEDRREKQVRLARQKIFLRGALDHILSQVRLGGEVRVDEAGQAFYWVTQFGSDSPRAVE